MRKRDRENIVRYRVTRKKKERVTKHKMERYIQKANDSCE